MTTVNLLACSDLHVDEASPRWDECRRVLARIVGVAEERRPDLVLIPGDIYERRSTQDERLVAADFVQSLAALAPVVIVRGNHDAPRDLALLAKLESRHPIHVVEAAEVVESAGVAVACCAWPTRAGALDDGTARENLRAVLRGLGDELSTHASSPRILAGHFDVDGCVTGAGQPIIGGSLRISLDDLALTRAHAVIAGHIHRAQEWEHGEMPVLYCGSPFRTDFGETEEKSVLWMRVGAGGCEHYERIDTGARAMCLIEAEYRIGDPVPELRGQPWSFLAFGDVKPGADVRLRYTTPAESRAEARREAEAMRNQLIADGAATVKVEERVTATTRARAPEVAAARTLSAKLESLWLYQSRRPEPAVTSRLLGKAAQLESQG